MHKYVLFFGSIIACFCLVIVSGCSKTDRHAPGISITSPTNDQVFASGQTVHVLATITDNSKINTVHLRITNLNNGDLFLHIEQQANATSYSFDQTFTAAAGTTYNIEVEANNYNGYDNISDITVKGQ